MVDSLFIGGDQASYALDRHLTYSYKFIMHQLTYTRRAEKALTTMPRSTARTIRDKLRRLAENPYAPNHNATKLQGRAGYRLRVGDWRVIYDIIDGNLVILVLDIGPRGGIYS